MSTIQSRTGVKQHRPTVRFSAEQVQGFNESLTYKNPDAYTAEERTYSEAIGVINKCRFDARNVSDTEAGQFPGTVDEDVRPNSIVTNTVEHGVRTSVTANCQWDESGGIESLNSSTHQQFVGAPGVSETFTSVVTTESDSRTFRSTYEGPGESKEILVREDLVDGSMVIDGWVLK